MGKKQLPDEFREFIQLLILEKVQYLVIGGWAVSLYGNPRFTADIDFFVGNDAPNIEKILTVLQKFGLSNVPREYLEESGNVLRLGFPPNRIEMLTSISGVAFRECFKKRTEVDFDGMNTFFISKDDLIKNKKAAGRQKDLTDAEALEKPVRKPKKTSKSLKGFIKTKFDTTIHRDDDRI